MLNVPVETLRFGIIVYFEYVRPKNADNGIDDTFDAIQYHRPRRAAFSSFIGQLHAYHHITKSVSPLKGSKQILRLSEDTLNGLAKALAR
jgi:hypothetical protein